MKKGDTMYTGQNYQIALRTSETCYVYVYQAAASGEIVRIFPGEEFMAPGSDLANPVKGGEIHWIPGKRNWLKQDDTVGKEVLFVVASRSRNKILEDLYSYVEQLRRGNASKSVIEAASRKMEREILMMPSRVTTKPRYEKPTGVNDQKIDNFELLARIFESPGLDVSKAIWFFHKDR